MPLATPMAVRCVGSDPVEHDAVVGRVQPRDPHAVAEVARDDVAFFLPVEPAQEHVLHAAQQGYPRARVAERGPACDIRPDIVALHSHVRHGLVHEVALHDDAAPAVARDEVPQRLEVTADHDLGRYPVSRLHHDDLYTLAAVAQPVRSVKVRPDEVVADAGQGLPIEESDQLEGDAVPGVPRDQVPLRLGRTADGRVRGAPLDPDAVAAVGEFVQAVEVRSDPTAEDLVAARARRARARHENAVPGESVDDEPAQDGFAAPQLQPVGTSAGQLTVDLHEIRAGEDRLSGAVDHARPEHRGQRPHAPSRRPGWSPSEVPTAWRGMLNRISFCPRSRLALWFWMAARSVHSASGGGCYGQWRRSSSSSSCPASGSGSSPTELTTKTLAGGAPARTLARAASGRRRRTGDESTDCPANGQHLEEGLDSHGTSLRS